MIKSIEIINFCTIENTKLDLSNQRLIMIVGGSGTGKSSLLGSIYAALYGSFPDKAESSLYNDVSDPSQLASIKIELELGQKNYTIERVINHDEQKTLSYVYDDQNKLIVGPQFKGVQEWVNDNVMDRNAFLSLYYLSQKSKQDLCEITPYEASKVLLQLLGVENLYPLSKHFSGLNKDVIQSITGFKRQLLTIGSAKAELEEKEDHLQQLHEDVELINAEIKNIDDFLENTHDIDNAEHLKRLQWQESQNLAVKQSKEVKIEDLKYRKREIEQGIREYSNVPCKKTSFYSACPLLNGEGMEKTLDSVNEEIKQTEKEIEDIDSRNSTIKEEINRIQEDDQYNIYAKRLLSINERNTYLQTLTAKNKELGATENIIEQLQTEISKELVVQEQIKELDHAKKHSEFLSRVFSKEGISSILIEQALPEINNLANDICINNYLSFRFKIESFKEMKNGMKVDNVNVLLIDESGKSRHVSGFSGGERQLAQVVLRFAIQEYLSKTVQNNFSIFMGDEIWSQMDANSTELCFNIISSRNEFSQVIVISHSYDLVSKFDCIIETDKKNNLTSFNIV